MSSCKLGIKSRPNIRHKSRHKTKPKIKHKTRRKTRQIRDKPRPKI
jgi:hypothetical protein